MKKTYRLVDVVFRVSDIIAAHIPNDNQRQVVIYVRGCKDSFAFNCDSCKAAESLLADIQKLIEDTPE